MVYKVEPATPNRLAFWGSVGLRDLKHAAIRAGACVAARQPGWARRVCGWPRRTRLATLKGEFDKLYMEDGEALDDYAGKISGMAARYAGLGATLDDAAMVKKLLDTVPDRLFPAVAGFERVRGGARQTEGIRRAFPTAHSC
jgi:hypothetical protein